MCTLGEGDDFGKLALVNDSPRAATILTAVDGVHLLRVDKDHFDRSAAAHSLLSAFSD